MSARDRGALVLGTVSGASAWISLGALAVTSDQLARVGVLPPLWALGACLVVGFLAAWVTRLRTDEAWPLALTLLLWLPCLLFPLCRLYLCTLHRPIATYAACPGPAVAG